jgi:hypothetical protein
MTAFEITVFAKSGGPLTKRISLSADGSLKNDSSACLMASGSARRCRFTNIHEFADGINRLSSSEALSLGALPHGLDDPVAVETKHKRNGSARPNIIARTQDYIRYRPGQPALALLDFDLKGMSPKVAAAIAARGGFWGAVMSVIPEMAGRRGSNAHQPAPGSTIC